MVTKPPYPPVELMQRVGWIDKEDVRAEYEAIGLRCRRQLERLLGEDWSWDGKRVLDFGCGAGRTLRHFLPEAERAEFYGSDIDEASIAWAAEHLSPPLQVFVTGEEPKLPQPDGFFDLVYAFSVFTHLTDEWAGWLLELHRVLKTDGLLFATTLGELYWRRYEQGDWDEDRVGMNVIKKWNPWDAGGPVVFHSEWWLREHWGRAFEIETYARSPDGGQDQLLLRRGARRVTAAELERPGDDPRELEALRTNVEQLHREASGLRAQFDSASDATVFLQGQLDTVAQSRSWRLTAPLRSAAGAIRRRRPPGARASV